MNTPKSGKPAGKPVRRDGVDPVLRSRARRRALQAIYAWQISGGNAQTLLAQFAHEQAHEVADLAYFEALVHGVLDHRKELDAALAPFVDRGDMEAVAIVRDAEVNGNEIVWPADITDDEKAAAIEQLAVHYILVRT